MTAPAVIDGKMDSVCTYLIASPSKREG